MPNLYQQNTLTGTNIDIMGYPFYIESITTNEYYNRRDEVRNKILGGTEDVLRGGYIGRDFTITTHIPIDPNRPDVHNQVFREMMSKPVEVISPELGGKFMANIVVKPTHTKQSHLELSIDIKEVPGKDSLIPGESKFVVPAVKKVEGKDDKVASEKDKALDKELNKKLVKCRVPYKKNQLNVCVKLLQDKLVLHGFLDEKHKTGKYDAKTVNAVRKYQRSTKGKLVVDGVFGKYTLASLVKEVLK